MKNNYDDYCIRIKQKDIIKLALQYCDDENMTSRIIHDNKWMDFEGAFEKYGWIIEYDKPAYNETYDAVFEFKSGIKT